MKKAIITFFVCLLALFGKAQNYVPDFYRADTSMKSEIRTAGLFNYHTSSLPNSFVNYFINGGKIENDVKYNVSGGLSTHNTAGSEQQFAIRYTDFSTHPFKDKNWGFYLNLEHQDHIALDFTKTLFDLVFYGNGPYVGEHLDLSGNYFARYTYQKIGFGMCHQQTGTSFGVSLVKGQSYSVIDFSKGDFYTDDSTANITFGYTADISRSDTAKTKFSAFNGVGLSVDLSWNITVLRDTIVPVFAVWQLRVNNAGFLNWNSASLNYSADSTVQYNGFTVSNFFRPEESLLTGNSDLKDTLNIRYEARNYFTLLPVDIVLVNYVNPYKGYWLKPVIGFRYKLIQGFKPMYFAGATMRFGKNWFGTLSGSYGGFGGLRIGFKVQAQLGKHASFVIGSSNVDGLYAGSRYGKDGYFGFAVRF